MSELRHEELLKILEIVNPGEMRGRYLDIYRKADIGGEVTQEERRFADAYERLVTSYIELFLSGAGRS